MSKRIIAVFGPTHREKKDDRPAQPVQPEILQAAAEVGARIAAGGHILLTGGDGSQEPSVKDAAIRGAGDEWVGVLKGAPDRSELRGNVIQTDLGPARNFLEALMCDAVIAFHGGEGTRSEVACAFALRRPIAFVGCEWRHHHHLGGLDGHRTASALLQEARAYLETTRTARYPRYRELIDECLSMRVEDPFGVAVNEAEPQNAYFELVHGEALAGVVEWATKEREDGTAPRPFPVIDDVHTARATYRGWIARLERQG